MSAAPPYGPWQPGIDQAERTARLRELRALCAAFAGGPRQPIVATLVRAEHDPAALEQAWQHLEAMPTRWRRNVLTTMGRLGDVARAAVAPQIEATR